MKCDNFFASTVIQNLSEETATIAFSEPFDVTVFQGDECQLNFVTDYDDCEIDKALQENLSKQRLEHTNEEERESISKLCHEYRDIFYCDKIPLSFTNQVKHSIRTANENPIYIQPYRHPHYQNEEIQNQVDSLLKDNVIQESHSPWSAPVHLVPKKSNASGDKRFRMVLDYRRLNEITVDDKYPLPNITDLFDKLGKATYFSTLDLASGFHQIEVEAADRPKTAFSQHSQDTMNLSACLLV